MDGWIKLHRRLTENPIWVTGKFIKPNTPFAPFFEKLRSVYTPPTNALTPDNLLDQYFIYIKEGHSGFRSETDDKTMIIGFKSP